MRMPFYQILMGLAVDLEPFVDSESKNASIARSRTAVVLPDRIFGMWDITGSRGTQEQGLILGPKTVGFERSESNVFIFIVAIF